MISLLCSFFISFKSINIPNIKNERIVNVYGLYQFKKGMTDNSCVAKVFQVTKSDISIDNCYLTIKDLKLKFEVEKEETKILSKSIKLNLEERNNLNGSKIFEDLFSMSINRLREIEAEINSSGCDNTYGFDIEIIENESRTIFTFGNTTESCVSSEVMAIIKELRHAFST